MKRYLTRKNIIIGGIVGLLTLAGLLAMTTAALAQSFPDQLGFGPRGFAQRGAPGGDFFSNGPHERGFFQEGPRRGGKHGPRQGAGGEVTAIDGSTLTVENRDGETETINITAETRIFLVESAGEGSIDDIQVGSHVKSRGPQNDDGAVEARDVMVMPAGDMAGGRVTDIDGGRITVDNRRDGETTVIVTDDSTEFRLGRDNQAGSLSDVTSDSAVAAFGETQSDGSLAARLVLVHDRGMKGGEGDPRQGLRGGEVTAIDGANLTVENRRGDVFTVLTDDSTEYRTRSGDAVAFEDIEVSGHVMVKGEPVEGQENTVTAEIIGIFQSDSQ